MVDTPAPAPTPPHPPPAPQVNGEDLSPSLYSVTDKDLTLTQLPAGPVTLSIVTEIKPQENSSLEGLYKSSGNFCTQVRRARGRARSGGGACCLPFRCEGVDACARRDPCRA